MNLVMEHQELYKGYHLVVMFVNTHRCGYVGLPKGHELIGKDYNNEETQNLEVHGGITYGSGGTYFKMKGFEWYIGFDTAHAGDKEDLETAKKYGTILDEIYKMHKQINDKYNVDDYEQIRTKEYVLEELYNLVEQLEAKK